MIYRALKAAGACHMYCFIHHFWHSKTPKGAAIIDMKLSKILLLCIVLMAERMGLEPTWDKADLSQPG